MEAEQKSFSFDKNKLILPAAILIAAFLVSGAIIFGNSFGGGNKAAQIQQGGAVGDDGQKVDVSADDDAFLGDKKAKVVLIEFSDFQCPFCRRFWKEALPLLKKEFIDTGKIKFVYRDFPLSFHPAAQPAAEASECAKEQGKYWELHDKIFEEQEKLGEGTVQFGVSDIKKWAKEIGLNQNQFNECLDSGEYKSEVEKDAADGATAGVNGTPTVFVNGKKIVGAQPFSVFKAAIEAELK